MKVWIFFTAFLVRYYLLHYKFIISFFMLIYNTCIFFFFFFLSFCILIVIHFVVVLINYFLKDLIVFISIYFKNKVKHTDQYQRILRFWILDCSLHYLFFNILQIGGMAIDKRLVQFLKYLYQLVQSEFLFVFVCILKYTAPKIYPCLINVAHFYLFRRIEKVFFVF